MKHLSEKIEKHQSTLKDNSAKLAILGRQNIATQLDDSHRMAVRKHEEVDKKPRFIQNNFLLFKLFNYLNSEVLWCF